MLRFDQPHTQETSYRVIDRTVLTARVRSMLWTTKVIPNAPLGSAIAKHVPKAIAVTLNTRTKYTPMNGIVFKTNQTLLAQTPNTPAGSLMFDKLQTPATLTPKSTTKMPGWGSETETGAITRSTATGGCCVYVCVCLCCVCACVCVVCMRVYAGVYM